MIKRILPLSLILLLFVVENGENAFSGGNASKADGIANRVEEDLSEDAVVALADFKVKDRKTYERRPIIEADFEGTVTRFLMGSDKTNTLNFHCRFYTDVGALVFPQNVPGFGKMIMSDGFKDCLVIYKRQADGSPEILRMAADGLDQAPAYEWLEKTKDRKTDRPALAVMLLMDKET